MPKSQQWMFSGVLFVLLAAGLLIYWPGLAGPLLLDDFPNLRTLERVGPVEGWSGFWQFVLSQSSVYPSRPLSFASFLLNDNGWPLHIEGHKYTNVLIHLLNGALVFWLALLLCRLSRLPERQASLIALSSAALWLLAPLQVSTVLYVIQRMTSLSALFVLAGLVVYCQGRLRLNERPAAAFVLMTTGVVVFGTLGFLAKENAVLLPLFALVMERSLVTPNTPVERPAIRRCFRAWRWLCLVAPLLLALGAILWRGVLGGYVTRPFTAFERIASQPRILFDYLQNLLIPMRQGTGLAHDDYLLSTGLLTPPTTLLAIAALAALIVAALYLSRRGASLFAFALLWFASGHLMESSILALEPYFEHRNYLPGFGLYFALSCWVWTTRLSIHRYLKLGLVLYLACFVFITKQNVDIWSSKVEIGENWALEHPTSVRAQQIRADVWSRVDLAKAHSILARIADKRPDSMAARLQYLLSACRAEPGHIDRYLEKTTSRLRDAHFDHAAIPTLLTLNEERTTKCPSLTSDKLLDLVDSVLNHDSVVIRSKAVADLLYGKARILAEEGEIQAAASHLYAAFNRRPSYALGITSVEFLFNVGAYEEALKALEQTQAIELPPFSPNHFRHDELEQWHARILKARRQTN